MLESEVPPLNTTSSASGESARLRSTYVAQYFFATKYPLCFRFWKERSI